VLTGDISGALGFLLAGVYGVVYLNCNSSCIMAHCSGSFWG
jgi:hypothetical protein